MFKKSIIYTLSSILSASIPFLLLPILTRYLSPEQYGQVAMFNLYTTALVAVIGLSVVGAANRRFFEEDASHLELARFNGNCVFILLVSTLAALLVMFFFGTLLASYLGIPSYWIYLGIMSVFFAFMLNLRLGQWQIRGKAKSYGVLQVINSLIVLLFSLLFVISLHLGAEGRIYGIVITSMIIAFFSYYSLRKAELFIFEYNREDIKYALSFGVPLIPHVVGGFLLLSVDRLVINKELGLGVTGIYMVAVSLAGALNIVFNSINKAYSPWLFGVLKENNDDKKIAIVKNTYLYFVFLILMLVLAFFIAPPILRLVVGVNFYDAANILPILMVGQVFLGMYFMVTNYIFYVKKTKYLSYVTISSGVINLALLFLLIPIYGLYGAAFSFIIANFCQFVCTWLVSAKLYPMPWVFWRK